jgi:iron-sulfur cluster assembly accessory protein
LLEFIEEFNRMVQMTEKAIGKVREIMASQTPSPAGLRIAVVGGGCSGFSYSMAFENTPNMLDKTYQYGELKVFVDQASLLYLDGAEVDYVETLEGQGFKFNNPQVKSTCGCGSSFQV